MSDQGEIDSVMVEKRIFAPSPEFSAQARVKSLDDYQQLYNRALADIEGFWEQEARQHLHWFKPFTQTLDWQVPHAKWFVGGTTNVS